MEAKKVDFSEIEKRSFGSLAKELSEGMKKIWEQKELDKERITEWNTSYLMNLEDYFKGGLDESIEIIRGGKLRREEVVKTMEYFRGELEKRGFETKLSYLSPEEARTTTAFYDKENLYLLKVRKKSK